MSDRISTFLVSLKDAARETGHEVEINLNPINPRQWMLPTFSPEELESIAHKLPRGIAVQGREGPDGRPFGGLRASSAYARGAFYPVVGLTVPDLRWLRNGRISSVNTVDSLPSAQRLQAEQAERHSEENPNAGRRLIRLRSNEELMEFNARLTKATAYSVHGTVVDRLAALRAFAVEEAGESGADALLAVWLLLDDASRRLDALKLWRYAAVWTCAQSMDQSSHGSTARKAFRG